MTGPAENPNPATATVRVLLVGGSESDVEIVRGALANSTSMAFHFRHVARLALALELLDAKEADVMLLDYSQGDTDGLTNLMQLRLRAPLVPTVVMSDVDDESLALETFEAGARGFLVKGEINTRLLVTTLRAALESHQTLLQLKTARERASRLATHDELTGLANRFLFNDRLSQAVAAAHRNHQKLAILFLDLNGFKQINDSMGHSVGDELLRGVAQRATACLRKSDTAARLGGDEFAVLVTQLSSEADATQVAAKILGALAEPMLIKSRSYVTTASVGIATFPKDGVEPEDLLKKADTAMDHAKRRGQNCFELYTQEMNAAVLRRVALENGLRSAIEEGAFLLHYQPQFDLRRGRIIGSEALLRWMHPELGFLSPMEFLPLAEETGLIAPIGEWVLRTACRQNATWQNMGYPGFRISVNVSSQQFHRAGLLEAVQSALQETGLPPECLELEMTERHLVHDAEVAVDTLRALKEVGVRLSIDDFGTGYSALAYLKRFPVDVLKIDQSFVRGVVTDPADAAITESIIRMAKGLNLTTVAEGVETLEQLRLLGSYGCWKMQGYLFGKPCPPEGFVSYLTDPPFRWNTATPAPKPRIRRLRLAAGS